MSGAQSCAPCIGTFFWSHTNVQGRIFLRIPPKTIIKGGLITRRPPYSDDSDNGPIYSFHEVLRICMPRKNPPGADKTCGPDARVRSVAGIDGIAAGPPQRNPSLSVAPSTMDIRKARRAATRIRAMAACEACKASRCASTNSLVQLSGLVITAHAQLPAQGAAINVRAGGASNTNSPPIAKSLPVR